MTLAIRQWISRNGGLGLATIYLSGPERLTARGQKAAQLGGSKPHQLAAGLLRELAAEGKG